MRKSFCFLLLIFYLFSTGTQAQNVRDQVGKKILQDDSTVVRLQRVKDSIMAAENRQADNLNRRALVRIMKEQDERRKKEKRWAYIRMGIGIVLLIILILGLKRRGKKRATS